MCGLTGGAEVARGAPGTLLGGAAAVAPPKLGGGGRAGTSRAAKIEENYYSLLHRSLMSNFLYLALYGNQELQ